MPSVFLINVMLQLRIAKFIAFFMTTIELSLALDCVVG